MCFVFQIRRIEHLPSTFEPFLHLKGTPAGSRGYDEHPAELDLLTVLTPDTSIEYLLNIDLEATREDRRVVIEFPVLLYDTHKLKCIGVFHSFCKPVRGPILTQFCTSMGHPTFDSCFTSWSIGCLCRSGWWVGDSQWCVI